MFVDRELIEHLETNNTIKINSLVVSEWNQNILTNIKDYGNYRWRPDSEDTQYRNLMPSYDQFDFGNFYTNALESNTISKYRTEDPDEPLIFLSKEAERELYYSLKECFKPFRPRSGINKILYFDGRYVDSIRSARRPRFYFSSKQDKFKYWTSYRKEDGEEYGISSFVPKSTTTDIGYQINDAAPFVVYNNEVAVNRIIVKMQTLLSDSEVLGIDRLPLTKNQIRDGSGLITDPLQDRSKSSIPKRWAIQYLDENNNWVNSVSFDENSTRKDGSEIVKWDGYVELFYGIKVPEKYRNSFKFIQYIDFVDQLPTPKIIEGRLSSNIFDGEAYIVGASSTNPGELYVWDRTSSEWYTENAAYGFSLLEDDDTKRIGLVSKITEPFFYQDNGNIVYREFSFIKGLRIVVETMNSKDVAFDLIEMSPRLKIDMSEYLINFEISKNISATDYTLPVGGVVASVGKISIHNDDLAFTEQNIFDKENNTGSIVANLLRPQIKFDFYETVYDVNGFDKFIPLKTMYSENAIVGANGMNDISINLRDAFFLFESFDATQIFLQNTTLTMAVALLLDNIGFSNYIFKGISDSSDPIIPFFFVEPDTSVVDILQRLAQSTQTAMFFDEYNNFVIMPKEYLMPSSKIRDDNDAISERLITLYGQKTGNKLPNIEAISNTESAIVNDGQINYTTRYIEREVSKLEQAQFDLSNRTYGYKSALLWEIGDQEELRTINQPTGKSGYVLGAVALKSTLGEEVPFVQNGEIQNSFIDVGEDQIWLPRFQGYLYANGEIIRYDAQEYTVSGVGNVWITNNNEYQKYFSKLPFNGKIFPTGNLRIYVEPFYEELPSADLDFLDIGVVYKNGPVRSHGRGQFGTNVVSHSAGINPYWEDIEYRKSFRMDSSFIFSTSLLEEIEYPPIVSASPTKPLGEDLASLSQTKISGKISNFMKKVIRSEKNSVTIDQSQSPTLQASALVFEGPSPVPEFAPVGLSSTNTRDIVSYVYKEFSKDYKHVGTRIRIIGKQVDDKNQYPQNATEYYTEVQTNSGQSSISGGSGGMGYFVDKKTNSGYYFEICSLTKDVLDLFKGDETKKSQVLDNLIFYKILPRTMKNSYVNKKNVTIKNTGRENIAIPVKLWGSEASILVDSGNFVGMDRLSSQDKPTVYDIGIEHEVIGTSVRFYLYLNNSLIATVIDNSPLPSVISNSSFTSCLFVRGSSKCMFENIYAVKNRMQQKQNVSIISSKDSNGNDQNSSLISIVANNKISISEALRKYALSGIVQSTYLSSIGTEKPSEYEMYFEEFGTIMRECAYFNIKYDQAYPALKAKIIPPFNAEKTYVISGFIPSAYGAEFLIFNSTDKAINLGDNSANKIMIAGITFTQNISNVLTVDDYFREISNLADPFVKNNQIKSPERADIVYEDIKNSRSLYGSKSFSLNSPYIQNEDSAIDLMSWIVNKTLKPRKILEIDTFATPHLQLGDIVKIDYTLPDGVKYVEEDKRFVVITIRYRRDVSGVGSSIRLVEV
jgi:hypothetical protein